VTPIAQELHVGLEKYIPSDWYFEMSFWKYNQMHLLMEASVSIPVHDAAEGCYTR
jgi:hypothetical protein